MARKRFKPLTPFDVSDQNPVFIARQLHALQRDMRIGFELLDNRLATIMQSHERRLDSLEDQVKELRRECAEKRKRP